MVEKVTGRIGAASSVPRAGKGVKIKEQIFEHAGVVSWFR